MPSVLRQFREVGAIQTLILLKRKLKLTVIMCFAQGHLAKRWEREGVNLKLTELRASVVGEIFFLKIVPFIARFSRAFNLLTQLCKSLGGG